MTALEASLACPLFKNWSTSVGWQREQVLDDTMGEMKVLPPLRPSHWLAMGELLSTTWQS